jgi:large subunit ribosomal protein L16
MFEIDGVTIEQAKEAFRLASHKLPLKTKFAFTEGLNEAQ